MKAKITSIKRFSTHDGNGIRTTVFFKGCPLSCLWCHNPETISFNTQIAFYEHKCTLCGACEKACEHHKILNGVHFIDKGKCNFCEKCASLCPNGALEIFGKEMTVSLVAKEVLKDKIFYDESGGGVTLSGGECLAQADFCAELLKTLKQSGINTAVDTCGYAAKSAVCKVAKYTDMFLYDIKAIDENVHVKCTGKSNALILENLKYINSLGVPTEVRVPYVPGFNDDEIEKIGDFLSRISCVQAVRILPYHNLAQSKYSALGQNRLLSERLPANEELASAREKIRSFNIFCI